MGANAKGMRVIEGKNSIKITCTACKHVGLNLVGRTGWDQMAKVKRGLKARRKFRDSNITVITVFNRLKLYSFYIVYLSCEDYIPI